jgi:uncharacterized protein
MTLDCNSDETIAKILSDARVFAVVGASNKPERPSFHVIETLIDRGYTVYPVNPGLAGQEIHGRHVYATLSDVPAPVDIVDIFRNSADALGVVEEAIDLRDTLGISVIWMQLGVINLAAAAEAEAAGLTVVMDRCPKIELSRLIQS